MSPIELAVGVTTVLTGVLTWLSWKQRPRSGATAFAVATAGVTWWIGMFFLGRVVLAVDGPWPLFVLTGRLEWAGTHVMAVAWFVFALALTGRGEYATHRAVALLGLFPAASYPVAFLSATLLNPVAAALGLGQPLSDGFEFWYSIQPFQTAYIYTLLAASSILIVVHVFVRRQPHPERAVLWLLAIAPPWILNALYVFGFSGYFWPFEVQLDPTPFGFVGTVAVGLLLVSRLDGLEAAPVARAYVVDQLDTGVVVCDDEFRVVDYNDWAADVLDLPADVVGRDVGGVVADATTARQGGESAVGGGDESEASPAGEADPDRTGGPAPETGDPAGWLDGRTVQVGAGHDVRTLSIEVSPLQRPDGRHAARGYAVVLRDVTARIERERSLETQNEQLELLNRLVHHDIRNEMGLLLDYVRRARSEQAPGEGTADADGAHDYHDGTSAREDYFEWAEQSGERVLSLAEAAHDLTQAVVKSSEELEAVPLAPTLEREVANASVLDPTVDVDVDGRLPDCAVLANDLLPSVFWNLLSNAVQHAGDDGTQVTVSASRDADRVLVRVADDGPGIPDEHAERVFQRSFAFSETGGTGVGLYLVRTLVDDYDGDVWLEDGDRAGTTFVVSLRVAEATGTESVAIDHR